MKLNCEKKNILTIFYFEVKKYEEFFLKKKLTNAENTKYVIYSVFSELRNSVWVNFMRGESGKGIYCNECGSNGFKIEIFSIFEVFNRNNWSLMSNSEENL